MTKVDATRPYWLLDWLAVRRIRTTDDALRLLSSANTRAELRRLAQDWTTAQPEGKPVGVNLVAGTGLRLDDDLTCPGPACRRQQIDVLFRHAWHYFDRVLLPDAAGALLLTSPKGLETEGLLGRLRVLLDVAIHIKELGAAALVHYYPLPGKSSEALDAGIGTSADRVAAWDSGWSEVESALQEKGDWRVVRSESGRTLVTGSDSSLGLHMQLEVTIPEGHSVSDDTLVAEALHEVVHHHMTHLEEDLVHRHTYGGHLGSSVWSHELVLGRLMAGNGPPDALLRLELPWLAGVPIRELIGLRAAEGDAFQSCRSALAKAARELIRLQPASDLSTIAAALRDDVVEPELARLKQRLAAARRAMKRKTALYTTLGAVSTACGLVSGLPLAHIAGIAVMLTGAGAAVTKYLDEKQGLESSDMFFLWKGLEHAE